MKDITFSKYERARILGARALQISMDAPVLLKLSEEELSNINFDPLRIAERELDSGVLPITIIKPMPKKKEEALEKIQIEKEEASDQEKIEKEKEEEQSLMESGEVMPVEMSEEEVVEEPSEESGSFDSGDFE